MERIVLGISLKDKIHNEAIRQRTKVTTSEGYLEVAIGSLYLLNNRQSFGEGALFVGAPVPWLDMETIKLSVSLSGRLVYSSGLR